MGTEVLSPGVKQLAREVDHSPPSTARVDDKWSCTPACLQSIDRDFIFFCVAIFYIRAIMTDNELSHCRNKVQSCHSWRLGPPDASRKTKKNIKNLLLSWNFK
jgi:hypothetical protein